MHDDLMKILLDNRQHDSLRNFTSLQLLKTIKEVQKIKNESGAENDNIDTDKKNARGF
jgi:hypothetical protein